MPRRHRGGRKSKPKIQVDEQSQVSTNWRNSPVARAIIEKITKGGVNSLEDNFERIMVDSFSLADEPEFNDLYFDLNKTNSITTRFAQKYEKRVKAAQKKGEDEAHQVFDQMRIEIIDELARPPFRKDVLRRLDQLSYRLTAASDTRKLETAIYLDLLLHSKSIPWGICGLILAIYDRSIEQTLDQFAKEEEILHEVMDLISPADEPEEALSRLQDIDQEKNIRDKLEAKPELRERLERQVDKMVEEFEHSLFEGDIKLDIFTQEEIHLPFDRLQEKYEAEGDDFSTIDPAKLTQDLPISMRDSLVEIITPDRFQEIKRTLEGTSNQWLRENNKWTMTLRVEMKWLDDYKVGENYFLMAAYAGQIRRDMKSQGKGESRRGKSKPSKSRGLVGRANRLSRKENVGKS